MSDKGTGGGCERGRRPLRGPTLPLPWAAMSRWLAGCAGDGVRRRPGARARGDVAGAAVLTWARRCGTRRSAPTSRSGASLTTLLFALARLVRGHPRAPSPGDTDGAIGVTRCRSRGRACWDRAAVAFLVRPPAAGTGRRDRSVPVSLAVLAVMAATGTTGVSRCRCSSWLAGAAFLGAAYDGLFLGHWYLTDRKLTRHADRPVHAWR